MKIFAILNEVRITKTFFTYVFHCYKTDVFSQKTYTTITIETSHEMKYEIGHEYEIMVTP